MSEPVPISLGKGSNRGRHGPEGVASFVNCYVEKMDEDGKMDWPIYAINGLASFATLTNGGAVRAMLALDSQVLIVAGRLLYSTNIGGSPVTQIGGIPSDGFVTMARNRRSPNPQVVIVSDGQWFTYEGGSLTQGSDSDLPPPICVVEIAGFFVFLVADGRWFISAIDDVTIDGLEFTEAQFSADSNVMGAVRGQELVIFGQRSTEFYVLNDGSGDFPFTRMQTASIGCYAAGSVQKIILQPPNGAAVDSIIWAATDHEGTFNGIRVLDGYTGTKISNGEVDRLIRAEPDPTSIRSMAWTENEHSFYAISGTSFTKVWDGSTGKWHDRKSYGLNRWRCQCHAQIGQVHLFGDYASNLVYRSDEDTYDEAGNDIVAEIITPPVHMFPSDFVLDRLFLDVITGVGAVTGSATDTSPQLMIEYSDDGGASWGGQRLVSLGAAAQRHTTINEVSFGMFGPNGVSFKLSCSAAVIKAFLGASVMARKLAA